MKKASGEGSVIIVNVTILRSDAIVISSVGVISVSLPHVDAVQAQKWVDQQLTTASSSDRCVKNKAYRQFLAWLWCQCVKPILTELGHHVQSPAENLPRVWWIGSGLASSFPFHAACDTSAGPTENTFCRVLSSYTPSVKALMHARERVSTPVPLSARPLKLLIVTMANTPGARDLPGVKAERSSIMEYWELPFTWRSSTNRTPQAFCVKFINTATAEPRQDILSFLKVCENPHAQGEIAYLSACSTVENRAKSLMDEVLHVVSGFQVAGFRHVIGSLWPSDDNMCVEIARAFNAEFCRNGTLNYTDRAVAMALHKAVSEISRSDKYRKRPLLWAQYVHYGT